MARKAGKLAGKLAGKSTKVKDAVKKSNKSGNQLMLAIIFSLVLFVLVPSVFLIIMLERGLIFKMLVLPGQLLVFLFVLSLFLVMDKFTKLSGWHKKALCLLASLYYLIIYFLMYYWVFTGHRFNIFLFLDAFFELIATALKTFGFMAALVLLVFFVFLFIYYIIFMELYNMMIKIGKRISFYQADLMIAVIIVLLLVLPTSNGYLLFQFKRGVNTGIERLTKQPCFPDNSIYNTDSDESVFILQIESGNSFALMGEAVVDGIHYDGMYMPYLYNISHDGVFLPFFFGNSMQTNRAQANILCGVTCNFREGLSYFPEKIETDCLPKLMDNSGYKTIVFRSEDLKFANEGDFMKAIGFEEVHHDDIMKEEDILYDWGYDDCDFYNRAFDYLEQNYPAGSKLFVYFEVSSHHALWDPKDRYIFTHKFDEPTVFIEKYLNSFLEQDYCVSKFYERFKKYNEGSEGDIHLLILPDHSWPVGMHNNTYNFVNAYNENFMVPFLYIPPDARQQEFKVGEELEDHFSETDIIPTIFELLNGQNYKNSFAFALRNDSAAYDYDYENCHVLVQPYDEVEIAVVRGYDKFIYKLSDKSVTYYNFEDDRYEMDSLLIGEEVLFEDFIKEYYCERFKSR